MSSSSNFFSFQGSSIYIGSGDVNRKIEAGAYSLSLDPRSGQCYLEATELAKIDKTTKTKQMTEILGVVTTFANNVTNKVFQKHNFKSKFGLLLEGPPGTGKSQTVNNAVSAFVGAGGIVVFISDNDVYYRHKAGQYLKALNTIQSETPILLVFEDIDSIPPHFEVFLTSILDGEQSPSNTFFLATTNFIENVTPRILRPGRFDLIYTVEGLDEETRKAYINDKLKEFSLKLNKAQKEEIYSLTDKFNFSEIRTFMAYLGFFGFDAKNLASKIAREPQQDVGEMDDTFAGDNGDDYDFGDD